MRKLIVAAVLLTASIAIFVAANAADPQPARARCVNCGMYTDVSSTRVLAQIKVDGKLAAYEFECIGCMREKLESWGKHAELKSFAILDYSTFKGKNPTLLDSATAWYLFDTTELAGSMGEPAYIAAFATKESATAAQKKLGGTLIEGYDALADKIEAAEKADAGDTTKVAGKEDTALPEVWVCPCTGGCCDDIKSDKPGDCPKCGMKLVQKK